MSETQDDLTLVYMFGFRKGQDSMKAEIERLRAALKHYSCDCTDTAQCPPKMLQDCDCGYVSRIALAGEKTDD